MLGRQAAPDPDSKSPWYTAMDLLGHKDPSLRQLVGELLTRLHPRPVIVVDHWESDPFAIGLATAREPDRLVYLHSEQDVHGRYFMSRELPSDSDLRPYREAGSDQYSDLDALAAAIAGHLDAT